MFTIILLPVAGEQAHAWVMRTNLLIMTGSVPLPSSPNRIEFDPTGPLGRADVLLRGPCPPVGSHPRLKAHGGLCSWRQC